LKTQIRKTQVDDYQKYIALSRYSRWDKEKGRRETYGEVVDRVCDYWLSRVEANKSLSEESKQALREVIG
jgi:hypothetical protein